MQPGARRDTKAAASPKLARGPTGLWFLFFFFFFMAVLGLCCYMGFSLVVASGGYSLAAVHRLLTAVASLLAERGL